jgi:hypothetical protein
MTGKNRIIIFGPKDDGTDVVEFRTAAGEVLSISIPRNETAVVRSLPGADAARVYSCRTRPPATCLGGSVTEHRHDAKPKPPRPHVDLPGGVVFRHACKLGFEGIVSKRLGSRSPDWLNTKNPAAPAVRREAEEDWGRIT